MVLWVLAAAAAAAALFAGYMVAASFRYRLDVQTVAHERLPGGFDGTRVLFISDVHRRVIPDAVIARCADTGGAELVLVGGDLREKGVPLARSRTNIRKLRRIAPIYLVYGNNDHRMDIRPLEVMLEEERVRVLSNESVVLEKGGSRIRLAGVDDPRTERDRLPLALEEPEGGGPSFTLLLAHDPIIATRISPDMRIDLALCGDTHGGQVVLPLLGPLVRRFSVMNFRCGWFRPFKQPGGETFRMFVSCGFGTSGMPIRFGTPAELHLFTLTTGKGSAVDR
ncbi:metallophosphoesterase [Paenibacillus humicola]|uniref:metallophosphoesterase n=1 Tax=Paenibacillus humicola TaxID=3110540 RepID=UPI00237A8215|nr:metallophosphoesterase [Paenibacillus humicola]